MSHNLLHRLQLSRAAGEIAIVVAGILIAFALDAWWERRSLAAREQAHLRALAADYEQNAERLADLVRMERRISAASLRLHELAEGGAVEPDTVRRLMSSVFMSNRFDPVVGAYEALVSSGGLAQIRDDSLRAALARFAARAEGDYQERYSDELYFAMIRDFLGRLGLSSIERPDPADAERFRALLADPRFREYLYLRHLSERDMAAEYAELLAQAEAVRARLGQQLR